MGRLGLVHMQVELAQWDTRKMYRRPPGAGVDFVQSPLRSGGRTVRLGAFALQRCGVRCDLVGCTCPLGAWWD